MVTCIGRLNMTKYKVVLLWLISCLCCEVVMTGCEVVLVNRNVTDSFRVEKDGCMNNASVCTNSATCQPDGLCLCNTGSHTFRNPIIERSGGMLIYGSTYGCIENFISLLDIVAAPCPFKPFQVIPYSHKDPVTKFSHNDPVLSCSLIKTLAKFPNNATEKELQWLDESYVGINVSNNVLYFKWERSVPALQGTIITFHLDCLISSNTYDNKCLRAKVLGTWPAETASVPTEPAVSSTKIQSSPITPDATSPVAITTTAIPKPTVCSCSDEKSSDSTSKIFIALFSICIVVNVVLGIIVGCLWKDRQRIQGKNLQVREMQHIDEQEKGNTGETSVRDAVVDSGIRNDGINEESFPSSRNKNNNGRLSGHKYEEPSNYEPLRRNLSQEQNEDHNYQSLTTSQKRE